MMMMMMILIFISVSWVTESVYSFVLALPLSKKFVPPPPLLPYLGGIICIGIKCHERQVAFVPPSPSFFFLKNFPGQADDGSFSPCPL